MKATILACALLFGATSLSLAASSGLTAVDVVSRLYRQFAWEAMIETPLDADGLIDQPRAVLSQYFDEQLTTLILRDRECAAKAQAICNLDFVPLWASQDPAATGLSIVAGSSAEVVNVTFLDPRDKRKTRLSYRMKKGAQGWRIADIRYSSGPSLLTILQSTP